MSFRIRAARDGDLDHLYEMAKLTGGGFTNLPADRRALKARLDKSSAAFARTADGLADEAFVLMLENVETGDVRGTCQMFSRVGQEHPFYSYRIGTLSQASKELKRTFRAEMLVSPPIWRARAKSAGCSSTRASAPGASACCSRAAAICSSRCTARALPTASLPSCAESSTRRAGRRSGMA